MVSPGGSVRTHPPGIMPSCMEKSPVDLLANPILRNGLIEDMYIEQLSQWVVEHPEQSDYIQEQLLKNIDTLSLTGYEILWHNVRYIPGWKETLWVGLKNKKNSIEACLELNKRMTGTQAPCELFVFLHGKLSQRSEHEAHVFSQGLLDRAMFHALCGLWKGSQDLFCAILDKQDIHSLQDVNGMSLWASAAHKVEVIKIFTSLIPDFINILQRHQVSAKNDTPSTGETLLRVAQKDSSYIPLLYAWMDAQGPWQQAWVTTESEGAGYFGPTPFGETAQAFGNDRPQEKRRTATA